MKTARFLSAAFFTVASLFSHAKTIHPKDFPPALEKRIDQLISKLTLEEKVSMLGGHTVMDTAAVPRLGIPALRMADGPVGIREGKATAFPSGIALAASFDTKLAGEMGGAIAEEASLKGKNMLLAPAVNLTRHPFGGRNFESYGEDPILAGKMAAGFITAVQDRNMIATVKHLAVNDQEYQRMTIDTRVDLRTLYELHLPMFRLAIDAGTWSVMSAYNRVNGKYASESDLLQNQALRTSMGFKGFVVSDWGATHSTVPAANSGLDIEMPQAQFFNQKLVDAVKAGEVKMSTIDEKVRRILRALTAIGEIDPSLVQKPATPARDASSKEHQQIALKVARQGAVLLKNDDKALPLRKDLRAVSIIGPNAAILRVGGGGSSTVDPLYAPVSPLDALRKALGEGVKVTHARGAALPDDPLTFMPTDMLRPESGAETRGVKAEYYANTKFEGAPVLTRVEEGVWLKWLGNDYPQLAKNFSARWSGEFYVPRSGDYRFVTLSDDGIRVKVGGETVIENWAPHRSTRDATKRIALKAGTWVPFSVEYYQVDEAALAMFAWITPEADDLFAAAVKAAKESEVAIVFTGFGNGSEGEGVDRPDMHLQEGQAELISAVADANPNTIVVLNTGNAVTMQPWASKVKAIVQQFYPGQAGGTAIAELLTGKVNFMGKLPITYLKRWEDSGAFGHYPGENGAVTYNEGVFLGYRHFDAKNLEVNYPFGHGLSYTTFELGDLRVHLDDARAKSPRARVYFEVKNTGAVAGAEVPQLYVGEVSPALPRPPRELRDFRKVFLKPGQTKTVEMSLDLMAFAYFDAEAKTWKVKPGKFTLEIGTSSRDLRLKKTITLK